MFDQAVAPTTTPAASVSESMVSADRVSSTRTVYEASAGEIFWRQFLAGFSRALGSLLVYVIFLGLMFVFISRFVWPQVKPFFDSFTHSVELLESTQQQTQQFLPLFTSPPSTSTQENSTGSTGFDYTLPTNEQIDQLYQLYQQTQPTTPTTPSN